MSEIPPQKDDPKPGDMAGCYIVVVPRVPPPKGVTAQRVHWVEVVCRLCGNRVKRVWSAIRTNPQKWCKKCPAALARKKVVMPDGTIVPYHRLDSLYSRFTLILLDITDVTPRMRSDGSPVIKPRRRDLSVMTVRGQIQTLLREGYPPAYVSQRYSITVASLRQMLKEWGLDEKGKEL